MISAIKMKWIPLILLKIYVQMTDRFRALADALGRRNVLGDEDEESTNLPDHDCSKTIASAENMRQVLRGTPNYKST